MRNVRKENWENTPEKRVLVMEDQQHRVSFKRRNEKTKTKRFYFWREREGRGDG